MKKAVLVKFSITTRVVINDDMSDDEIVESAVEQIIRNGAENYICSDNWESITDDTECPYNEDEEFRKERLANEYRDIQADCMAQ